MKAILFDQVGGPEVLRVGEVPKPEILPGMVLIKNHAIGVNFADVLFRRGTYLSQPSFPDTPGLEAAGVIEAVGPGVEDLKVGMRVAAVTTKTYAEYTLAKASQTFVLPTMMSFERGAAFPIQTLTAYHMIHTAHQTTPKQTVLVHSAAGGVGGLAVQIARAAGARVIGTISDDGKAALVKENGADLVINYVTHDFAEEALRFTDGKGVNLILDAVGKPTLERDFRCLAPLGRLILYGRAGGSPDPFNLLSLLGKSHTVSGFVLYTIFDMPEKKLEGVVHSLQLMQEGKLRLRIGKTFPLAQAAEAHRYLESRQSAGKLVLIP
ncbi:MAG TPA: quinone oxidoreductase [Candidatus Methylomirabilis sp.]|nr:quinone oxidoreductase [Candidatus Methylomirabilis sp.]